MYLHTHPALLLSVVSLLACLLALRVSSWARLAPAPRGSGDWRNLFQGRFTDDVERRWK
jgi:hypothetical protein